MTTLNPNIPNPPVGQLDQSAKFDDLPAELVEVILQNVQDMDTLSNILRASPMALRVFHNYPTSILGSVLKPGRGSEIEDMMGIVAAIRLGKITSSSLNDFCNDYLNRIGKAGSRHLSHMLDTMNMNDKDRCLWIPETAYKVRWHTNGCLKYYMDRFMALRLEEPCDLFFQYEDHETPPWRRRVASSGIQRYHSGPPSAREELVVLGAFWRTQIEYELQNAFIAGTLDWPDDKDDLFPFDVEDIWGVPNDFEFMSVMYAVSEYVKAVKDADYPTIADDDDQTPRRLPAAKRSWPFTYPAADDLPEGLECDAAADQKHPHPGVQFWNLLRWHQCTPLHGVSFCEFHEWGFALWDLQRFCASKLLSPDEEVWDSNKKSRARDRLFYTWRKIVAPKERREIDNISNVSVPWPPVGR